MTRTINETFHRFTAPLPKDRMRRLKISAAAWAIGTVLITTLWVVNQWQANGAFVSFGHEGDPGEWNPTLWAVIVGVWGLIVGIQALRVYFERHGQLERWKFDVCAWLLGMAVITPLWALIEWQDNGAFERWSNDSLPGDWEPWFLYVGGIWALVIAFRAVRSWLDRDVA
jgi:H+/Cl- antiporter ClcA